MRWILIGLFMCSLLAPAQLLAQEEDDEESEMEIETVPDDDEEEEDDRPRAKPSETRKRARSATGATRVPARVKGQKIGTKKVTDESGIFTLHVPSDWELDDRGAKKNEARFNVYLPGAKENAQIWMRIEQRVWDPRGMPEAYYANLRDNGDIMGVEIRSNVTPHLLYRDGRSDPVANIAMAFAQPSGHTVQVQLSGTSQPYELGYAEFLQVVKTIEVSLAPWPTVPAKYKQTKKGGYVFAVHPSVMDSTRYVSSIMKTRAKAFTRVHGKLPRPARGAPLPHVFVHLGNAQAKAIDPDLNEASNSSHTDNSGLRLFTTPVQKGNREGAQNVSVGVAEFYVIRRYGPQVPLWVRWGEGRVAMVEFLTGKKLPYVHTAISEWQTSLSLPGLDELERPPESDHTQMYSRMAFYYVAFFHAGPKKYRKVYKAYLDDIGKNLDRRAAAKKHFEPVGYRTLREEATKFMSSKIVYFTPK